MTAIFKDIPLKEAIEAGFFVPKEPFSPISTVNHVYKPEGARIINDETEVFYYPGAFGYFHIGHHDVVEEIKRTAKTDNFVIVISPSNSDYTVSKYGADSLLASNKFRYDSIRLNAPGCWIDLNPMLNHRCDQNFDDMLDDFLKRHSLSIDLMKTKPVIVCGKDRSSFENLNRFQNKIRVAHINPGDVNVEMAHASNMKDDPTYTREKVNCYVRVHSSDEFELFKNYFGSQYKRLIPIFIQKEKELSLETAWAAGIEYTICKDYSDLFNYIKVSRLWKNPLEQSDNFYFDSKLKSLPKGTVIIDSDSYTGSTKNFIEKLGYQLRTVINVDESIDYDIIDIDDFKNLKFTYPEADVSSRCNMDAFDYEMHHYFLDFLTDLNGARND